ncbi:MAG TPA: twin-arginine translocase TatA/TatE family subunit [Candidatus Acidoferrum sp.]|nr:twin-arginine translocase TatA/TatE family subunit [Candidatus Acidoferrum sp.]
MGEFSIFHWMVVLAIILIFFGGKRIPEIMKGFGEGIRNFKEGMSGSSHTPTAPPPQVQAPPAAPTQPSEEKK